MNGRRHLAAVALASLASLSLLAGPASASSTTHRRMTPLQVANFALTCASHNKGSKLTSYFDIRCAAGQSTNIEVVTGVVGGPNEYPAYSSVGFLLDTLTHQYTCFAFPDKVGARPVNITNNCPLWIMPPEYHKTNYPSTYAIASSFSDDDSTPLPSLADVQTVATNARGAPKVSPGQGRIFSDPTPPELTLRVSYSSGVGRIWCVWFYQHTDIGGNVHRAFLISPPGMYGTC